MYTFDDGTTGDDDDDSNGDGDDDGDSTRLRLPLRLLPFQRPMRIIVLVQYLQNLDSLIRFAFHPAITAQKERILWMISLLLFYLSICLVSVWISGWESGWVVGRLPGWLVVS